MSNEWKNYVISLLEDYQKRIQQIALLRYELEHPAQVSPDEMIGTMSFAHGDGTGRTAGHISNKTLYIALNYQEQAEKINTGVVDDIAKRLVELEQEQNRLLYYISLLDKRQAEVIQLSYFEKWPQEKAAEKMQVSTRTVQTLKAQAIASLAEMYRFAFEMH